MIPFMRGIQGAEFTQAGGGMAGVGLTAGASGIAELLFNGDRVSVLQDEKNSTGGDSRSAMCPSSH